MIVGLTLLLFRCLSLGFLQKKEVFHVSVLLSKGALQGVSGRNDVVVDFTCGRVNDVEARLRLRLVAAPAQLHVHQVLVLTSLSERINHHRDSLDSDLLLRLRRSW